MKKQNIMTTVRMLQEEFLDLRTVTMGINIVPCIRSNKQGTIKAVGDCIRGRAERLVEVCDRVADKYGVVIVNKRLAVSPVALLIDETWQHQDLVDLAKEMDAAAAAVGVDLLGGFSALVQAGMTEGERRLIEALPEVLSQTDRVCASVNLASSKTGINVDAALLLAEKMLQAAQKTANDHGFGAAKLVAFANAPDNNPFMAGAFHGVSQSDCVVNVGVSGPGVVKRTIDRRLDFTPDATLDELAEEIKHTAFRVTRTGELIGREVAASLAVPFGVLDLSLAPTPKVGDSVGEIYKAMGVERIGAPGTTAAVAMVNDAVKKGGAFASSKVGGLSGAFIPVMEDHCLAKAVENGELTLQKLEAMTSVCSVGLDMVLVPGDISEAGLCGLILDEAAIGMINRKTTGVRLIPVPGAGVGERVEFGGLFGTGTVVRVDCHDGAERFVSRGGHIPAPLQSLSN